MLQFENFVNSMTPCLLKLKVLPSFCFSNKVQLLWEGHKNLYNLPYGFDIYLVNIKSMRKIAQIFVAFSEKLTFTIPNNVSATSIHSHGFSLNILYSNIEHMKKCACKYECYFRSDIILLCLACVHLTTLSSLL